MAYEIKGFSYSLQSSGDLSSDQYKAVVVNSDGEIEVAGAAATIDGVLQNDPEAQYYAATIMQKGISKAVVGTGACTAGDLLEIEAGGDFITRSAGAIVGRALETGVAGDIISVLLY